MLLPDQLESFFEKNNIPLQSNLFIGEKKVDDIFINALEHGLAYASFILNSALSPEKDSIATCFESFDKLYESYACFMMGFEGLEA